MNIDDINEFILYGKQSTTNDQQPALANLTLDHLREMMKKYPQPSVWETGPIYVVGLPGNVHRFVRDMERMSPPIELDMPILMHSYGSYIIPRPSNNFPDADYIFLMAGKEIAKVYMISMEEFMKRWKRDGEELAAVIKRLENYNR